MDMINMIQSLARASILIKFRFHIFSHSGEKNAHDYTGFHNWYQFLLEQQRNPPQTTNICFKQPPQLPGFVENRLVSYFI